MLITTAKPPVRGVLENNIGLKNSVVVRPGEDISAKYAWLTSSDRDSVMGAKSVTNRRTLILSPGKHTLSALLTLDTEFVDVTSLSGNPKDTHLTKGTGSETVLQTADDVCLYGFTIENTGSSDGDHGFNINATDNSESLYQFMTFIQDNANCLQSSTQISPVYSTSDMSGTWENCKSGTFGWRQAANKVLSASMFNCVGESSCFGGDETGIKITGTFYNCIANLYCFGGCTAYGCDVSGTFYNCESGQNSFAMGKEFSGNAYNCISGRNSFAGSGSSGNPGTFSGYAENCITAGGCSFGMGFATCIFSGQVVKCRNGSEGDYASGRSGSYVTIITDNGIAASLTTALTGLNNDLVFTARHKGDSGTPIWIEYKAGKVISEGEVTVSVSNAGIQIQIKTSQDGDTTANEIKAAVQGDADASWFVSVEDAPANDGTGNVPSAGMVSTVLTGGIAPPFFSGNHPWKPTNCADDYTIAEFDNGHTYTNEGATSAITITLPPAIVGLEYTIVRSVETAGCDVTIQCDGAETINGFDGTLLNDSDEIAEVTLACRINGQWEITNSTGTWT